MGGLFKFLYMKISSQTQLCAYFDVFNIAFSVMCKNYYITNSQTLYG